MSKRIEARLCPANLREMARIVKDMTPEQKKRHEALCGRIYDLEQKLRRKQALKAQAQLDALESAIEKAENAPF